MLLPIQILAFIHFFMENTLAEMKKVINIIKVNQEKDGLFTKVKLRHLKYQMNGILGYIIPIIK